jgi:hypothetical protein
MVRQRADVTWELLQLRVLWGGEDVENVLYKKVVIPSSLYMTIIAFMISFREDLTVCTVRKL